MWNLFIQLYQIPACRHVSTFIKHLTILHQKQTTHVLHLDTSPVLTCQHACTFPHSCLTYIDLWSANMPTCLHLLPLLSYIYIDFWSADMPTGACSSVVQFCILQVPTCLHLPLSIYYIYIPLRCRHAYTCMPTNIPTCLPTCCDFFWRINLNVINPKFKIVDLVGDCAFLPLFYFLTNSYHTQTFIHKDTLESKDWFLKWSNMLKGEFCQDQCLKGKSTRNPTAVWL